MSYFSRIEDTIRNVDYEKMKELIDNSKDVDLGMYSNKLLRIACIDGDIRIVKTLLKRKEVDPANKDGYSAIKNAFDHGNDGVVRLLLKDKRVVKSLSKENLKKYKDSVPMSKTKENLIVGLGLTVFGLILNEIVDKYV